MTDDNDETEREVSKFVLSTLTTLRPEDYLFTVKVDTPWDVYKFHSPRGDGTVALRMVTDPEKPDVRKAEIGFFRRGDFTADEVTTYLARSAPS